MEEYLNISDEELNKKMRELWEDVSKDNKWVIYPDDFDKEEFFKITKKN